MALEAVALVAYGLGCHSMVLFGPGPLFHPELMVIATWLERGLEGVLRGGFSFFFSPDFWRFSLVFDIF